MQKHVQVSIVHGACDIISIIILSLYRWAPAEKMMVVTPERYGYNNTISNVANDGEMRVTYYYNL